MKSSALLLSDFTWDYALPGQPCRSCAGVIVFFVEKLLLKNYYTYGGGVLVYDAGNSIFIAQRFVIFWYFIVFLMLFWLI